MGGFVDEEPVKQVKIKPVKAKATGGIVIPRIYIRDIPIKAIETILQSFKSKWKYGVINPKTGRNWYPNSEIVADAVQEFINKIKK